MASLSLSLRSSLRWLTPLSSPPPPNLLASSSTLEQAPATSVSPVNPSSNSPRPNPIPQAQISGGSSALPITFACPHSTLSSLRRNCSHETRRSLACRHPLLLRFILWLPRRRPRNRAAQKHSRHRRPCDRKQNHQLSHRAKTHRRHHPRIPRQNKLQNRVEPGLR